MNIFIDARWTRTDYHDGISRYTAGLVQGFKENNTPITMLIHDKAQLALLPRDVPFEIINHPISLKEFFVARRLNELEADVVYSPLQVMGFAGRRYKLVLTLQDIIYYRYPTPPTNLPQYVRIAWRLFHMARWPQRLLLNRADHITTVSQTSKLFIQELGLTTRPIDVIYNAPSHETADGFERKYPTKSLLYMGSFMSYKNVETLVKGMAFLPGYRLHLLSKITDERRNDLQALAATTTAVTFHNGVSDQTYSSLLAEATALVTASKEEGFGLPIVEAQTLGIPVVCSDLPIFKEVAGEGALYFDNTSPEAFAKQVKKLDDTLLTAKLVAGGKAHASQFSWAMSAEKLLRVLLA